MDLTVGTEQHCQIDPVRQDLGPALPGNKSYLSPSLGLSFLTHRMRELSQISGFQTSKINNLVLKVCIPKWAEGDGEHLLE